MVKFDCKIKEWEWEGGGSWEEKSARKGADVDAIAVALAVQCSPDAHRLRDGADARTWACLVGRCILHYK